MRLAIVADTHLPRGRRRLPDRCVAELSAADLILHAGDLVSAEVLDALQACGPPVHAVAGNVDDAELRERLPETLELDAAGVRVAMVHDAGPAKGRLARLRTAFPDADAVVFGHSHIPLHERGAGFAHERGAGFVHERGAGFQIFNPGSPTDRRRQPRHTMGIATIARGTVAFAHVVLD